MYDLVVTLSREIQLFWIGRARPLSAVLYFSTKYLNLLAQVLNMVSIWDFAISDGVCVSRSPTAQKRMSQSPKGVRLIDKLHIHVFCV